MRLTQWIAEEGAAIGEQEIRDILKASPLFALCPMDISAIIARKHPKGSRVSDQADGRDFVVFLARGTVDVYSVALDGNEVRLSSLGKGECFGIANLFEASDLETVMKCRTPCLLLYIPKHVLQQALLINTDAYREYVRVCNKKIQFLIRRIGHLTMQSCRGKLVDYLITAADSEGKIESGCSKEELARVLGVSRAALFRELSFLQKRRLIQTQNRVLSIVNRGELEKLLSY